MKGTAVGVTEAPDSIDRRVIIVFHDGGSATVELDETAARKLVDDILRNANFLWPVGEDV